MHGFQIDLPPDCTCKVEQQCPCRLFHSPINHPPASHVEDSAGESSLRAALGAVHLARRPSQYQILQRGVDCAQPDARELNT
jgi:hypothetical protein